jgi:asparagine synthase (glutamine-hydrolysing)
MACIAGLKGKGSSRGKVEEMLSVMRHRGSDAKNIKMQDDVTIGAGAPNLSAARGDGFASDNGITMLFDGEIYNKREDGQSDAETALGLYRKHGMSFPGYLEGVFTCAVLDGQDLLLARDSVGVRPLYLGKTASGDTCFASEMKGLVGVAEEIHELRPNTTFSTKRGIAGVVSHLPDVKIPDQAEQAAAALRDCMLKSVERRLDDGAVGACLLSGGLDSSIIAAAVKHLGANMPTVTVGMEGAPDIENARIVAEHLGMEHHIRHFTPDEIEELAPRAVRVLESFEEDCVSGAISNLFASQKAAEFTNCILSGEGGDELFGGYHLLKDLPTQTDRLLMMERLIAIAYNTAVQRLDRSMMGNGITYRTPFIDSEVVAFASHVPVDWKIHDTGNGQFIEKWLLREAFKDMLPEAIYKRSKLRFAGGTGTDGVTDEVASRHVSDDEFTKDACLTEGGYRLQSPKELWYYREFKNAFPGLQFETLVGRWDPGKVS